MKRDDAVHQHLDRIHAELVADVRHVIDEEIGICATCYEAWKRLKRTQRRRQHQQRMTRTGEPDARPFLAAVERDDVGDPHEQEQLEAA